MAIDAGISLLGGWIGETTISGSSLFIGLAIIFISMAAVTRDAQKWKSLALPMAVAWDIAGAPINVLILIPAAIMMIIDALSLETIGALLDVTKSTTASIAETIQNIRKK